MDLGLEERSVLVMGASRGIGLACARGFLAEGARVAICGRSTESLSAALKELRGAVGYIADVSRPEDLQRLVSDVTSALGQIDVLVVNAGGPPAGDFQSLDDAAWRTAVELTLMSAIRSTQLVLPSMRARRWGRIVVISSFGVKQPVPGLTLSNSVRMAVLGWAKTLAGQVAADNVTINTVCPGWTDTDRVAALLSEAPDPEGKRESIEATIPMGRFGTADEIARLAVFLGSDAASYMTGTAVQVDGGLVQAY